MKRGQLTTVRSGGRPRLAAAALLACVAFGCGSDGLEAGARSPGPGAPELALLGDAAESIRAAVTLTPGTRQAYLDTLMGWSPDSPAWARERFGVQSDDLDPRILEQARDRADEHNVQLANLIELYVGGFEARIVEKFDAGDFTCNPQEGQPLVEASPGGFVGRTVSCDGWAVVLELYPGADSDLLALREEIAARRNLRDREVAEALRGVAFR